MPNRKRKAQPNMMQENGNSKGQHQSDNNPNSSAEADPCTVCLSSPMLPPIFQCWNGHVLCTLCEEQLKDCPTCREALPKAKKIRCISLEHWQPPLLKCKHPGCHEKLLSEEDVKQHMETCAYKRKNLCRLLWIAPTCEHTFYPTESEAAADHMADCHSAVCTKIDPKVIGVFPFPNTPQPFSVFVFANRLILLHFRTWLQVREIKPYLFTTKEESKKYEISIEMWLGPKSASQNPFEAPQPVESFFWDWSTRYIASKGPLIPAVDLMTSPVTSEVVHAGSTDLDCYVKVHCAKRKKVNIPRSS